jgi:cytochrome b involved in lipid metabolism
LALARRLLQVYDVSKWSGHPGGRVIFTHAGQDATGAFVGFHSGAAHAALEDFYIGECPDMGKAASGFEADVRALLPELHKRGLFKAR